MTVTKSVWFSPGFIEPPYTKIEGLFNLASPIRHPGIFLSHPPIATTPSND